MCDGFNNLLICMLAVTGLYADIDTLASAHPVRKFVIDFLRRIVIDSLSVASPNKSTPVIDVILEVSVELLILLTV